MNTIIYGAAGIATLVGSAFLFTYFENISTVWKRRMTQAGRLIRRKESNATIPREIALGIPFCNRNFSTKEKEVVYPI